MEFSFLLVLIGIAGAAILFLYASMEDDKRRKAAAEALEHQLAELKRNPRDRQTQANILELLSTHFSIHDWQMCSYGLTAERVYQEILAILELAPDDIGARDLALKVGRWHCSRFRPDNKLTIYDEQAIQNDLLVRCGHIAKL